MIMFPAASKVISNPAGLVLPKNPNQVPSGAKRSTLTTVGPLFDAT
jgi:hypothetical protein